MLYQGQISSGLINPELFFCVRLGQSEYQCSVEPHAKHGLSEEGLEELEELDLVPGVEGVSASDNTGCSTWKEWTTFRLSVKFPVRTKESSICFSIAEHFS